MADGISEKHLLAGLDERARGFTRAVDVEGREGVFRATFRYEALVLESDGAGSAAALGALVRALQQRGYRQIRTRLTFAGGAYLGTQEPWCEHADPEPSSGTTGGFAELLRRAWRAITRRS